jgi:hypothetical protein
MNLEKRFGDVETYRRDRIHAPAPPNRGHLTSNHVLGTDVPVEEVAVDTVIPVKRI